MTVAAVLLAGGSGSRFEGDTHKLLAVLDGRPLALISLLSALEADLDEVIVVTGAMDVRSELGTAWPDGVTVLPNPRWSGGMATSLNVAVDHAMAQGHEAIVVGLADQPFVTPQAWRALAAADVPIGVADYDGVRRNPVRLASSVWALLPTTGDEGARTLMKVQPELVHPIACTGSHDDIDTVEDLRRWS